MSIRRFMREYVGVPSEYGRTYDVVTVIGLVLLAFAVVLLISLAVWSAVHGNWLITVAIALGLGFVAAMAWAAGRMAEGK